MEGRSAALQKLIDLTGVEVEQKIVETPEGRTNYYLAGKGRPILLLHGAGAGALTWYRNIGHLSQHYKVIAPDIIGYGESEKPKGAYDRPFFSRWLKGFTDQIKLKKAPLIANSQGGAIALGFTLENPQKVEKLILAGSAALGPGIPKGALLGLAWVNKLPSKLAFKWMSRYLFYDKETADPAYEEYSLEVQKKPGGSRVFSMGRGKVVKPIPPEDLIKIKQPTLIIWGDKERFFPLSHAETTQKIIPSARLHIIKNAGHMLMIEQPEEFYKTVIKFLKEK